MHYSNVKINIFKRPYCGNDIQIIIKSKVALHKLFPSYPNRKCTTNGVYVRDCKLIVCEEEDDLISKAVASRRTKRTTAPTVVSKRRDRLSRRQSFPTNEGFENRPSIDGRMTRKADGKFTRDSIVERRPIGRRSSGQTYEGTRPIGRGEMVGQANNQRATTI